MEVSNEIRVMCSIDNPKSKTQHLETSISLITLSKYFSKTRTETLFLLCVCTTLNRCSMLM